MVMEPEARSAYEFITDTKVEEVGFIYKDRKKLVGCSPDGLLADRGLEIKCPSPVVHNAYYARGVCPKAYIAQVQGSMYVTGLKKWDFMSYHPDYEPLIVTVAADPAFSGALDAILRDFLKTLVNTRKRKKVALARKRRVLAQQSEAA